MSINTVLCAVDVNRLNDEVQVLRRAAQIAQLENAQLDVITVIPDYGMSVVGGFFKQAHTNDALKHARDLLSKMVEKTLGNEVNAKVRHLVGVGKAYHEVLQTAKKDEADLIVIGAQNPDINDYLLGPNAARVVRHARCSVYVVR